MRSHCLKNPPPILAKTNFSSLLFAFPPHVPYLDSFRRDGKLPPVAQLALCPIMHSINDINVRRVNNPEGCDVCPSIFELA